MGGLLIAAEAALLAAIAARLAGRRIPPALSWTVVLLAVVAMAGWASATPPYYSDADAFWRAGRALWEGRDPYAETEILNPPTAFTLFALFGLLPYSVFAMAWKILGLLGFGLLPLLAHRSLRADDEPAGTLDPADGGLLCAAVGSSVAVRYGILLGQLSLVTTLAVIAALACRSTRRPGLAGFWLAVASIKYTTMLPFLMLLFRRRDRRIWVALAVSGLLLTFLWVSPARLVDCLHRNLDSIRQRAAPGAVNDYSFAGPTTVDLIAFNHAVYHLGLRDRGLVTAVSLAIVGLLGLWILRELYRRPRLPGPAAAAIVSCYSAIFVYHRLYDTVILAIPLVYVFPLALSEPGRLRWAYRACALGILAVLFEPMTVLERLLPYAQRPGLANRLVEAVLLPFGTWMTLALTIALTVVERRRLGMSPGGECGATSAARGR